MENREVMKVLLWILSEYCSSQEEIQQSLLLIKLSIGNLPLSQQRIPQEDRQEEKKNEITTSSKIKTKTIILPDGTYGTQEIQQEETQEQYSDSIGLYLIKFKYCRKTHL